LENEREKKTETREKHNKNQSYLNKNISQSRGLYNGGEKNESSLFNPGS